ncbi:MAG TPA: DUF998 domain-containing protein [Gemmatimonadales bacterium]|nr:DUF998 domain-containing protein [Gemmatimonadales bacterium]
MLRKTMLLCGTASSLLYIGIDVLAALRYPAYHSYTAQAISELGAIGAPTREFVHPLFGSYNVLLIAFGLAVWTSPGRKRGLRVLGALLIGIAVVGATTPPMYLRGTGGPSGDVPHIVLTAVIVLFILSAIAVGASLYGSRWRLYSWATLVIIITSGTLSGVAASRLAAGQQTPWLGVAERINIGAYLLWVAGLAITLLRTREAAAVRERSRLLLELDSTKQLCIHRYDDAVER